MESKLKVRGGGLKRNINKQEKVRMVISNFAKERRNFLVWFLFNEQNIDSTFRVLITVASFHYYTCVSDFNLSHVKTN